jgi:hypothetical protein
LVKHDNHICSLVGRGDGIVQVKCKINIDVHTKQQNAIVLAFDSPMSHDDFLVSIKACPIGIDSLVGWKLIKLFVGRHFIQKAKIYHGHEIEC